MNNLNLIFPAVLLLFAFRIWRTGGRERPIRVGRFWILPLIVTLVIGAGLLAQPVAMNVWTIDAFVVVFLLGFGCGWFRGRTTHISVDAESGGLKARATPIGLVLVAALIFIRLSARDWLYAHAEAWDIDPVAIVDGFMLFALGLIYGWRTEMLLRCLRLLKAGQAGDGDPDSGDSRA
jgi:membrane protein CcdC involved in cytochrome C biogenesis